MKIIDLTNKTIIITGAGSGIGQETAITASKIGAKVIMLDISEDGLNTTMQQLEGEGHTMYAINLCETDSIAPLVKSIAEQYGTINGYIVLALVAGNLLMYFQRMDFQRLWTSTSILL